MREPETTRLARALHYAAGHHSGQRRKDADASPYINHPIGLLHTLAHEAGISDSTVLLAAVLHDIVEDCAPDDAGRDLRVAEIRAQFGEDVLAVVLEVTDDKSLAKEARKQAQIAKGARLSHAAKLVKLADKINNLRDIANNPPAHWDLARRQAYFDWARSVVDAMGPIRHQALDALFAKALLGRPSSLEADAA